MTDLLNYMARKNFRMLIVSKGHLTDIDFVDSVSSVANFSD